jgi:hypothetical protein
VDRNKVKGKGGGSVQAIEIEDGKVTLLVFGDINSTMPTHKIDMSGAQEANRAKVKQEAAAEPVFAVISSAAGYTAASTPDAFVISPQHIGLFKKNHIPASETFLPPVDPNGVS